MVGPFCFAFIWFRVEVAASPPFFIGAMFESGILVMGYQS